MAEQERELTLSAGELALLVSASKPTLTSNVLTTATVVAITKPEISPELTEAT